MNFLGISVLIEKNGNAIMSRYVPFIDKPWPGGGQDLGFWRILKPWQIKDVQEGLEYFWNAPIPEYQLNQHTLMMRDNNSRKCVNLEGMRNLGGGAIAGFRLKEFADGKCKVHLSPYVRVTVKEAILEGKRPPEDRIFEYEFIGIDDLAASIHNWIFYVTGQKKWEELT